MNFFSLPHPSSPTLRSVHQTGLRNNKNKNTGILLPLFFGIGLVCGVSLSFFLVGMLMLMEPPGLDSISVDNEYSGFSPNLNGRIDKEHQRHVPSASTSDHVVSPSSSSSTGTNDGVPNPLNLTDKTTTTLLSCPPWPPTLSSVTSPPPRQVLIITYHPHKTAGTTIARYLEAQEITNNGPFEMMSPWDETWFVQWLTDPSYREQHPKVFVSLHQTPRDYPHRSFRRASIIRKAKNKLSDTLRRVLQAEQIDNNHNHGGGVDEEEGFFEYTTKLLAFHAPRLAHESGARLIAMPHWREPGEHFVSSVMFLDGRNKDFRNSKKRGALGHTRVAMDILSQHSWPDDINAWRTGGVPGYYEPEYLLRYYFGSEGIVGDLHRATRGRSDAMSLRTTNSTHVRSNPTTDGMSFSDWYQHLHSFLATTSNVTLWTISDRIDQSLLLLAHHAGFPFLYERETCLPLWDVLETNENSQRKRDKSSDETIAAAMGRTFVSPASASIHPLLTRAHDRWWNGQAVEILGEHLVAIVHARNMYSSRKVSEEVRRRREKFKLFLEFEKFPKNQKKKRNQKK